MVGGRGLWPQRLSLKGVTAELEVSNLLLLFIIGADENSNLPDWCSGGTCLIRPIKRVR